MQSHRQARAATFAIRLFSVAVLAPPAAYADVTISTNPTANMNCSAGVCVPTATDAVLNTSDVQTMLASGDVSVLTTGSGVQADNIDVTSPISWTAGSNLTLDAYASITITGAVADNGSGGVSLVTSDGGSGTLTFLTGGNISISNLKNVLSINGTHYKLEKNIRILASDIFAHPRGNFALANDYDARADGIYQGSPVSSKFSGAFSGLGHVISNLQISGTGQALDTALFSTISASGSAGGLGLHHVAVLYGAAYTAALTGENYGVISNCWSSGLVKGKIAGGLLGGNVGTIVNSWSSASVFDKTDYPGGGLVGANVGTIDASFATGNVTAKTSSNGSVGGLVGENYSGSVSNSYATGNVSFRKARLVAAGGFAGQNYQGTVVSSYSIGTVKATRNSISGGFLGSNSATASNDYWDTTTSGTNIGVGSGSNSGITGLTTQQLQSGLPSGFDPTIWAENPNINNGFPYLIANPPPQ